MREQLEGSQAVARALALCRPEVIPAYPITPQTHIVEALGRMCRDGSLPRTRFLTVDSEFSAMSAAIGASGIGSRAYTATASQGLLFMAEALFNAAGLGFPVVMTVANRAIGAPINIWNDHSDSMSQRDCGWVQLYAADNQEAVDLHVLAFRLAEQLSVPVMVCVDGFVLTHAVEPVDLPSQEQVDAVLPPFRPRQQLDPAAPVAIGALVGPEAFTEVRYLADTELRAAEPAFDDAAAEWAGLTGRRVHALTPRRVDGARTVVVALGSVSGTVEDVVDRGDGDVGLLTLTMYRPFPYRQVREALQDVRDVVVLERSFSPGGTAPVSADVRTALAGTPARVHTVVAGLGGRAVGADAVARMLAGLSAGPPEAVTFLDLREDVVDHELRRLQARPGATLSAPAGVRS